MYKEEVPPFYTPRLSIFSNFKDSRYSDEVLTRDSKRETLSTKRKSWESENAQGPIKVEIALQWVKRFLIKIGVA